MTFRVLKAAPSSASVSAAAATAAAPSAPARKKPTPYLNLQANALPFSAHHRLYLERQLQSVLKVPSASTSSPHQLFASSEFIQTRMRAEIPSTAPLITLPLPSVFLNPEEDVSQLQARSFYSVTNSIKLPYKMASPSLCLPPAPVVTAAPTTPTTTAAPSKSGTSSPSPPKAAAPTKGPVNIHPRCGLTGRFFRREELVDNLIQAAQYFKFVNPFWVRDTHPQLNKYLELKTGSCPISISLSVAVVPVQCLERVPAHLIAPSLALSGAGGPTTTNPLHRFGIDADKVQSLTNKGALGGVNGLTGQLLSSPLFRGPAGSPGHRVRQNSHFAKSLPCFLSMDQVERNGLQLRSDVRVEEAYVVVEEDVWIFYNAEQLMVPGRLALKRSAHPEGYVPPSPLWE